MTQDQYHEALEAFPDETPILAPVKDNGQLLYDLESAWGRNSRDDIPVARAAVLARMVETAPTSTPALEGYDAEDLGVVIAEAVGSANDVDGVCWTLVGKLVIEALTGRK